MNLNLNDNDQKKHDEITKNFLPPNYMYESPDQQGRNIKKFSLLEKKNITYNNTTNQ